MAAGKPRKSSTRPDVERARDDVAPGSSRINDDAAHVTLPQPRIRRLCAAVITFGVWAAALIGLAVLTANPVTLNRAQILAAPVIVEGMFAAGDALPRDGRQCHVKRSWPNGIVDESIKIDGTEDLPLTAGEAYLIPLEPIDGNRYRIVTSQEPFVPPLIYPANPETVAQLEAILND